MIFLFFIFLYEFLTSLLAVDGKDGLCFQSGGISMSASEAELRARAAAQYGMPLLGYYPMPGTLVY